jgi:hypothetical protein
VVKQPELLQRFSLELQRAGWAVAHAEAATDAQLGVHRDVAPEALREGCRTGREANGDAWREQRAKQLGQQVDERSSARHRLRSHQSDQEKLQQRNRSQYAPAQARELVDAQPRVEHAGN